MDQIASVRGDAALNELRDAARDVAPALGREPEFEALDQLLGALQGTRESDLTTAVARARRAGLGYDASRMGLFESLRVELAQQELPVRPAPEDSERLFAFFEAYFSNWIEGTEFEVEGTFDVITDPRLRAAVPSNPDELEAILDQMHRRVMGGRPEIGPGQYKEEPNRAGMTRFVHPDLVRGTLREGFSLYTTLRPGLPRAIFAMFLVAEVHPFADGNGRVARALMNSELSAVGSCRVMIPLPYREEYLNALRALSRNGNPRPLWRMIDRAQRWAASMTWTGRDHVLRLMEQTNALIDPREVEDRDVHLLDPPGAGDGAGRR